MILSVLVGIVLAAPPRAMLGPDGPTWLGPFPPGEGLVTLVARPDDGGLFLRLPRVGGRSWLWTPGASLPEDLVPGVRVAVDDAGRPIRVELPTRAAVAVRWDGQGRVAGIFGPGSDALRLRFDEPEAADEEGGPVSVTELEAVDGLGHGLRVRRQELAGDDRGERQTVQSSTGRVVRSRTDAQGRLIEWTDPRGLSGRVDWGETAATVIVPGGGRWRLDLADDNTIVGVTSPLGHAWNYEVDADGRLLADEDPQGRVRTWVWDEGGAVRAVESEAGRLVVQRDDRGRLLRVQRAGGVGVRLVWGEDGRVARVEDGVGAAISFERDPQGRISVLQTRAGGRWSIDRDAQGAVRAVEAPTGERWRVERDAAGRVRTLLTGAGSRVAWQRGAGGWVTRVTAADGRVTGISRDDAGRVREVRPAGSLPLVVVRDPAGEISAVRSGSVQVRVQRDAGGRPLAAGPVAWSYDGDGRVSLVRTPVSELLLRRSPAGALTGLSTPDRSWELDIGRDTRDLPSSWRGTDGAIEVERDADGRIRVERGPAGEVLVGRDGRGLIDRVEGLRGIWRWMRDASGAVLRVVGPDGPAVGVVRDPAGRGVLERLPGGRMLLRAMQEGLLSSEVHDSADQTVFAHSWGQDVFGNALWSEVLGEPRQAWSLDGFGRLVGRVGTDERAWSFGPGTDQGPDGEVILRDRMGRLQEAALAEELPVFGVGRTKLAVHRDARGRMEMVSGDAGQARLGHDALGRLQAVSVGGAEWVVRWDARGRPGLITWPGGEGQGLFWSPDAVEPGVTPALAVGPGLVRALLPSPRGPLGWSTADGGEGAFARLPVDAPVVELTGGALIEQRSLPRGAGTTAGSLSFTGSNRMQLFGGGPSVGGDGRCLDPVLGQSTSGLIPWPWAHEKASEQDLLDPEAWAPRGPWSDPVGLLLALGEVRAPSTPAGLPGVGVDAAALAWLPPSLDRSPPPLALPAVPVGAIASSSVDEEGLLPALVAHLLHDGGPLPLSMLPGVFLDLPEFEDLPPGVAILGAPRWEERSLDPWTGRFSLARWGAAP